MACRTILDTAVVLGENIVKVNMETDFQLLSEILVFPKYKRGVKQNLKENPDIALLKLEKALNYGPNINAICLPSNPSDLYEDKTMTIAEWGVTNKLKTSHKLMKADVKVYPNNKCKEFYGYGFLKRLRFAVQNNIKLKSFSFHLCTYSKDRNSHCGGDSGGPLFMTDWQDGR